MTSQERAFHEFAEYAAKLKGDEKSEAQTFLFHLLEAFNHDNNTLPEGCTFEYRVRFPGDRTKFADLVWPGRVLIEMKSRGAKLSQHYQQTFDYWLNLVPHSPALRCPVQLRRALDLRFQHPASGAGGSYQSQRTRRPPFRAELSYPRQFAPVFGNNWVEVTREAAQGVADAFNSMVTRGEDRACARRYILQSVVAMFAEDIGLLPKSVFTGLLECRRGEQLRFVGKRLGLLV